MILSITLALPAISVQKIRVQSDLHVLSVGGGPGSKFVAGLEDNSVVVVDAASGTVLRKMVGHPQPVYGVAFNRAGTVIASGDETARIFLWNASNGAKIREFTRANAHTRGVVGLSFSADGKYLATTGRDDFVIIWDVSTGKPIKKIPGDGANFYNAVYQPSTGTLYTATLSNGARYYPSGGGAKVNLGGHHGQGAMDFAMSFNGSVGATGGKDNDVMSWNLSTKKAMATGFGHEDWVIHTAVSPNGKLVASSSADRNTIVWDSASMGIVAKLKDQSSIGAPLAFTNDGKYLISATANDTVQVNSVSPAQGTSAGATTTKTTKKKKK